MNQSAVVIALVLLLGAAGAWMAFGKRQSSLPQDASVLTEGFGTAVRLGMTAADAHNVKLGPKAAIVLSYFTPEELANHNLYKEHSTDEDLIAVILADLGGGPTVQGLRAYLGSVEAEGERAALHGKFAANLTLDDVKQIYGKPFIETPETNGNTHLVYYFSDPDSPGLAYKLTTSHDYTGKIFSMALEQVLAPQ